VDSPAWRHIQMLASLVSEDGNTPRIDGFFDNIEPLTEWQLADLKAAAARTDMKIAAANVGVARYIAEDPFTMLRMQRYGTSFNLDGIWGATCTRAVPARFSPTRSRRSTTSATCRT
jgi:hypothetical protein